MRLLRELRWRLFRSRKDFEDFIRESYREHLSLQLAIDQAYGTEEGREMERCAKRLREIWGD